MSKKIKIHHHLKKLTTDWKFLSIIIVCLVTIMFFCYVLFLAFYQYRFFPGVKIEGVNVSGQTIAEVNQQFGQNFNNRQNTPLNLDYQNNKYVLTLSNSNPQLDLEKTTSSAYHFGRSGDNLWDLKDHLEGVLIGKNYQLRLSFEEKTKLLSQIEAINDSVKQDPVNAQIIFDKDSINITPDKNGVELDQESLIKHLEDYLSLKTSGPPIILPLKTTRANFDISKANLAKSALEKLKAQPLTLKFEAFSWTVNQPALYSLLDNDVHLINPEIPQNPNTFLSYSKVETFLEKISLKLSQPVQNAKLGVNSDGLKLHVTEFQPAQNGQELDILETINLISQALASPESSLEITLPVKITYPEISTSQVNDLGIEELIGQGVSNFAGSITNRIYNIRHAAGMINGVLVPPGQNFSFTQTVGDISAATGFKQAYVIKSGRTVLDDGGGVCQVSTTLFRAALNTGLPIKERTAHAYRVGYYEQGFPPGLDATIFHPSVDLKFTNDTGSHILIQANVIGTTLYVNFYGKKDGRIVNLSTPKVTSQTPAPPELRQDDPTLPKGTVKQVDWAAAGANVSFKRTVERDGQIIIDETFNSHYRPWQAVFLVGTM